MGFHQKANLLGNIFSHLTEKLTGLIWEICGYIKKTHNIPELTNIPKANQSKIHSGTAQNQNNAVLKNEKLLKEVFFFAI